MKRHKKADRRALAGYVLLATAVLVASCAAVQLRNASCANVEGALQGFTVTADPARRAHHLSLWLSDGAIEELVHAQVYALAGAWGSQISQTVMGGQVGLELANVELGPLRLENSAEGVWIAVTPTIVFRVPTPIPGVRPEFSASLTLRLELLLRAGEQPGTTEAYLRATPDSLSNFRAQLPFGISWNLTAVEQALRTLLAERVIDRPLFVLHPLRVGEGRLAVLPIGLAHTGDWLEIALGLPLDLPQTQPPRPEQLVGETTNVAVTMQQDLIPWVINAWLSPSRDQANAPPIRFSGDGTADASGSYRIVMQSLEVSTPNAFTVRYYGVRTDWPCGWALIETDLTVGSRDTLEVRASQVLETSAARFLVESRLPSPAEMSEVVRTLVEEVGSLSAFRLPSGALVDLRVDQIQGILLPDRPSGVVAAGTLRCSECPQRGRVP